MKILDKYLNREITEKELVKLVSNNDETLKSYIDKDKIRKIECPICEETYYMLNDFNYVIYNEDFTEKFNEAHLQTLIDSEILFVLDESIDSDYICLYCEESMDNSFIAIYEGKEISGSFSDSILSMYHEDYLHYDLYNEYEVEISELINTIEATHKASFTENSRIQELVFHNLKFADYSSRKFEKMAKTFIEYCKENKKLVLFTQLRTRNCLVTNISFYCLKTDFEELSKFFQEE